jgi:hypothetical protein
MPSGGDAFDSNAADDFFIVTEEMRQWGKICPTQVASIYPFLSAAFLCNSVFW